MVPRGPICLRMKAWCTPLHHSDLPQQLPIRQNLDVCSVNKIFVFVPSLRLWFLISFKIIMHPSWIGLLLAAVRSSSGQTPKSVAFREWFLSFPHNYTLLIDELISSPTLCPELRPLSSCSIYFPRGSEGREEWSGEGGLRLSLNKCSGAVHDNLSTRHCPSPGPPTLLAVLKAVHIA